MHGKVRMVAMACPPNNLRRDLDNLFKATCDALTHAEIIQDDSQIKDLRIFEGPQEKNGKLYIRLESMEDDDGEVHQRSFDRLWNSD